ncbi:hypothetical protein BaRGS_00014665, partial [Batillaria attramentaria]
DVTFPCPCTSSSVSPSSGNLVSFDLSMCPGPALGTGTYPLVIVPEPGTEEIQCLSCEYIPPPPAYQIRQQLSNGDYTTA